MDSNIFQYNVIYKKEPEGGFTATVPTLEGCISYGETLDEAQKMIKEAINGYISSLKKHNEAIPTDYQSFVSAVYA